MQAQKESRRVEQLERKLANQRMLEEEEVALQSKASGGATAKVTHAQIEETKVCGGVLSSSSYYIANFRHANCHAL